MAAKNFLANNSKGKRNKFIFILIAIILAGLLVYAVNEKLSDSKRNNSDGSNGKSENKIEQDVKEEKNSTSESDAKGVFDGNSNDILDNYRRVKNARSGNFKSSNFTSSKIGENLSQRKKSNYEKGEKGDVKNGGHNGGTGVDSSYDKDKPNVSPKPDPKLPGKDEKNKKSELYLFKNNWNKFSLFIYEKGENENLEAVKAKVFALAGGNKGKDIFFGEVFQNSDKVLIAAPAGTIDKSKLSQWNKEFPKEKAGIYASDENNTLKVVDENKDRAGNRNDENPKHKMILFAGKQVSEKPFTARYLIGMPNNECHFGVAALKDTKVIAGINFKSTGTKLAAGSNSSAISLSREDLDLDIEYNTFTFDGQASPMSKAVTAYSANGRVTITNNLFTGKNKDVMKSSQSYSMIHFMSRSEREAQIKIIDNRFKDIASSAVNISTEKNEDIEITGNKIDGVNDDGINISIFPKDYPHRNKIRLKDNEIKNYGLGAYEGYSQGGAGKLAPSNDNESGISMSYVMPTFGAYVNDTWVSSDKELSDLLIKNNSIMEKAKNDKNDNVVNSKEVLVGQKDRFINTKKRINENRYGNANHFFVITKNENGTVTYGQNPDEPTENITVGGLLITGKGSGVVNLPPTLHIKGDLIVDLPNGSVSNHAVVSGKTEIKAQSEIKNDAMFSLLTKEFVRKEAPKDGVKISISNIKDDRGEKVEPTKSKLEDLSVFVNGKKLKTGEFSVDEDKDIVTISRDVANAWERNAKVVIKFKDGSNGVSPVSSDELNVNVIDKSNAIFEFDSKTITHFNPENKTITIKVKNITDKFGNKVEASKTKLKASFSRYGVKVADTFLEVDDKTDEIKLKPELLASIPASSYENGENQNIGTPVTYTVEISDDENGIGKISQDVQFNVRDKSSANFEFEKGLTFTQGEAPKGGIKLFVRDIFDSAGTKVPPSKSRLKDNINIEPFPVKRDDTADSEIIVVRDKDGNYVKEIFNPKYIKINDDEDSITFTKEYLDKMKTQNDGSTESGTKIFTFKYFDEKAKVDMRSKKVALYIKKREKARSSNTEIDFKENTLKIHDDKIVNNGFKIDRQTMVAQVLQHVIKKNPRQQVLVLNGDGKEKHSYDCVNQGDKLVVIAEDSKTRREYSLVVADEGKPNLIKSVKRENIRSYDQGKFLVKQHIKVDELKNSIIPMDGVKISVIGNKGKNQYEVSGDATVSTDHCIKAEIEGKEYYWNIRLFAAKAKTRALLIGNNDYAGTKMDLVGPPNDLRMMESVFKGNRISGEKTDVAVYKNLKKRELINAIHQTFQGATDEDTSYFYYSGHGNNIKNISYLCTIDDKTLPDGTFDPTGWISVDELKAELDKIPGKKILILDCCNAGGFIGKKFVDETSSATKNPGVAGKTITSDNSKAFNNSVRRTFESKPEENAKANYLTGNEYKVLTASSANEYSYEDKKEGIGKFTKMFAIAAGLENNQMKGDVNGDKKLSLNEAYEYLMKNVESTSHIQVFPYRDETTMVENVNISTLSSETRVESKMYNVNVRKNKFGKYYGSITAKNGNIIESEQTVEQFIGKFKKLHPKQEISVQNERNTVMDAKDKLGEGLRYLVVVAENGDVSRYSFSAKRPSGTGGNVAISSRDDAIEINVHIKAIRLTKNMTVREFISKIKKGDEKQILEVYPKGKGNVARKDNEKVQSLDYLLVTAPDGTTKQKYNITLMMADSDIKPDFGGKFEIEGNKIKSGSVKLTKNTTVGEIDRAIVNRAELQRMIDPMGSGVFKAGDSGPWARPKRADEKLAKGDIFKLKPIQWNKPAVQFVFELEDDAIPGSETPGSGNAGEVRIPKWQWQYKIQGDKIIDDGDTLGADKKYEDITKCLSNLADYTKFEYLDDNGTVKSGKDPIMNGGRIRFFNGSKYIEYILKFSEGGGLIVPPAISGP